MTRPRPASEAFLAQLPRPVLDRVAPIFSPLIEIVSLGADPALSEEDAVILTSASGVHSAPAGQGRAAYCVGAATTRIATAQGWVATQAGHDADSLVAALMALKPQQPLVHLSGRHTRGNIAARLTDAGLRVRNIALYDQALCGLSDAATQALMREPRVIAPLFSPRTASHFVRIAPRTASIHAIALSPAVAEALGHVPLAGLTVADRPDANRMGAALRALMCDT